MNNGSNLVGIFTDPSSLLHDTGAGHPECAARLRALDPVIAALDPAHFKLFSRVEPSPPDVITAVHSSGHLERVRAACEAGPGYVDPDTHVVPASWDAALRAAGAGIEACRQVLAGDLRRGFCATRPPGHHAEPGRSMGFCLFNNIAIAARWLQDEGGVGRVAIVDFDVHHGNGTQEAFWDDPDVLYASSHQFPHYPGTGDRREVGAGMGLDTTLNRPLPAGTGDEGFIPWFRGELAESLRRFKPEFILVSAGFDAHASDPLSGLQVSTAGFARVSEILADLADELCRGRLVSFLEGGYHLEALRDSVAVHLEAMRISENG